MKRIVAIDIGNTNITSGVFKGETLAAKAKIPTAGYSKYESGFKGLLKKSGLGPDDVDSVVISSVVPLALARLVFHLNKVIHRKPCIIGKDVQAPIKNLYRVKSEVGQDRLVNAFAAKALYGAPAVVIDFGTAITFDIVSAKGEYMGGLIMPGIELSLASLYRNTALLPRVDLKHARHVIGRDTVNSMRGGILFGFGAMCDGLVSRYKKILGRSTKVIATGGNAHLVKRYTRSIRIIDPDLTLKGLQRIIK